MTSNRYINYLSYTIKEVFILPNKINYQIIYTLSLLIFKLYP